MLELILFFAAVIIAASIGLASLLLTLYLIGEAIYRRTKALMQPKPLISRYACIINPAKDHAEKVLKMERDRLRTINGLYRKYPGAVTPSDCGADEKKLVALLKEQREYEDSLDIY